MFHFLRGIVLVAAMMASCGVAFAEDFDSANTMMRGCRELVGDTHNISNIYLRGYCMGIVEALGYRNAMICAPKGATNEQAIRVVVKYIDDQPARLNENFKVLALEALQAAWPCKN
jgi:Rap1a immunity proteins